MALPEVCQSALAATCWSQEVLVVRRLAKGRILPVQPPRSHHLFGDAAVGGHPHTPVSKPNKLIVSLT